MPSVMDTEVMPSFLKNSCVHVTAVTPLHREKEVGPRLKNVWASHPWEVVLPPPRVLAVSEHSKLDSVSIHCNWEGAFSATDTSVVWPFAGFCVHKALSRPGPQRVSVSTRLRLDQVLRRTRPVFDPALVHCLQSLGAVGMEDQDSELTGCLVSL